MSSPWFRNDSSWKLFVKSSSAKMESTDDENVSETMLMSALANLPSQDITMKEKYDTFKGEIYSAEKQGELVSQPSRLKNRLLPILVVEAI